MNEATLVITIHERIKTLKKSLSYWQNSGHRDGYTLHLIEDLRKEIKDEQQELDQAKTRIERAFFGRV